VPDGGERLESGSRQHSGKLAPQGSTVPASGAAIALGALYGPEENATNSSQRTLLTADATLATAAPSDPSGRGSSRHAARDGRESQLDGCRRAGVLAPEPFDGTHRAG